MDHLSSSFESHNRGLAQLVERYPYKVDVIGSNPVAPTSLLNAVWSTETAHGLFTVPRFSRFREDFQD